MMVRGLVSAVAAHERPERNILGRFHFVGCQKSETILVPFLRRAEIAHLQNSVTDAAGNTTQSTLKITLTPVTILLLLCMLGGSTVISATERGGGGA